MTRRPVRLSATALLLMAGALLIAVAGTEPVDWAGHTLERRQDLSPGDLEVAGAITFARSTGRTIDLHSLDLMSGELATYELGPGTATSPAWSQDETRLIFARRSGVPYNIAEFDPRTGRTRALTTGIAIDGHPSISPDGSWMVFASNRGAGPDFGIYRLELPPIGSAQSPTERGPDFLTRGRAPDITPDGRQVVFEKQSRIWSYDLASGSVTAITSADETHATPRVAPDGARLLTTVEQDGEVRIVLTELASGRQRPLTRGHRDRAPAWSPSGDHVVYVRTSTDGSDLYIVRTDGGSAVQVTDHPAADLAPTWHGSASHPNT